MGPWWMTQDQWQMTPCEKNAAAGKGVPGIIFTSFEQFDSITVNQLIEKGWDAKDAHEFKAQPVEQRQQIYQYSRNKAINDAVTEKTLPFEQALGVGAEFHLMTPEQAATMLRGIFACGRNVEHVSASPF